MALGWRGQYYKYREFSLSLLAVYKQRADVKAFLEIILSLSTLIIFIVFAIKPTVITILSLNKEIKTKEETLKSLNQKISDLQTANTVYTENASVIPDIESAIFSIPRPDTFSKQVLGIGQKNSVNVAGIVVGKSVIVGKTIIPQSEKDIKPLPEGVSSMPISINISGEYLNLTSFLRDFENSRIPVKIDSLTMVTSQLESGNNTLSLLVTGRIPYMGNND